MPLAFALPPGFIFAMVATLHDLQPYGSTIYCARFGKCIVPSNFIPKPGRDHRLRYGTGSGFSADFAFNFTTPQNGIGALTTTANGVGDGGHIRVYSGLNLTGILLGEADLGVPIGSFGGIITDQMMRSVQITREFDPDHDCGIYDRQFGTVTPAPVPLPAALPLFAGALGGMSLIGWRRRRRATSVSIRGLVL